MIYVMIFCTLIGAGVITLKVKMVKLFKKTI